MGCRADIEIAGKRVWENFSDARSRIGLNGDDHPIFIGRNRLVAYDLTSESPNNANGDLTSKTDGSGTTTYEYDALGSVRKVTPPSGPVIEYVIDGANRRVGKKVGGTLVQQFPYSSDLRIVAELNGSGALVSRFVYGTRVNVPEYIVKGANTYRVVTDHLGSVRRVVDVSSGTVAQAIDYDEFGVVLTDSAPGFQPFGFAGGLVDGSTGFVRFGRRDYSAREGRWTNKDPIGFAGRDTNLYAYVGNDSKNFTDPTGEIGIFGDTPGIWGAACYLNATAKANARYSPKDGPGYDKKKHCLSSCYYSRCRLGPLESLLGGLTHELLWWPGRGGGFWVDWDDSVADLGADLDGVADSFDFSKSCEEKCDDEPPAACDFR